MVDEHFYNAPTWFLSQFDRYDNRDRNAPPVYVGEIAVTSPEGGPEKGNLIAALAEGAFLMGLERNADVVRMVSYAPLLAHVKGRSGWHGMIYFDGSRVFGTVSYHLWRLFALNRPTYAIGTNVDYVPSKRPSICGAIGVGTWDTAAEFKEIRVQKNGEILYAGDFSKVAEPTPPKRLCRSAKAEGWTTEGGKWSVVEGAYRQSDPVVGLSYFGDQTWSDYTLTLKARKLAGAEGFLIVFGRRDGNKYWWNLGGWGNREHGIEFNRSPVGRHLRGSIEANRWYDIRVELKGRGIRCYLDDKLVHQESAIEAERFFALAGYDQSSGDLILKVINTSAEPVTATLNLEVADAPKPLWRRRRVDSRPSKQLRRSGYVAHAKAEAQLTVLTSERPEDNNSLENPGKVVPISSTLTGIQNKLAHAFPAYSLTVIRMKDPALREARPDE
jgi:alpha-L-arabinofuranosidase